MKALVTAVVLSLASILITPVSALAHCDTMNGPVVLAAKKALATGNVNLVLVWVQKKDEQGIRDAFNKTIAVRKQSQSARELADMYFFETLVRIHRAGERVAYTGLKSGTEAVEPGIELADKAIEKGSAREVVSELSAAMHKNIEELFASVNGRKQYNQDDVEAGREFVSSYVKFIHYVERLHQSTQVPTDAHGSETKTPALHQH